MKRLLLLIASILLVAALALGATQTINTLPSAGSSFLTNLLNFLQQEDAERDFKRFAGVILEGGIGSTSANLTHTVSACKGFPEGYYVSQDAVSHTYSASKRTFVYLRASDSTAPSFSGTPTVSLSYDGHFVFAAAAAASDLPATPSGLLPLMQVDTGVATISTVTDLRGGEVPAEAYSSLSDAVSKAINRTIVVNEQHVLTANLTVASTVGLRVNKVAGGAIRHRTYSVTINGPFEAGVYQVFNGSGTVTFGSGAVDAALPELWGNNTTPGTTDMTAEIQAAITAIHSGDTIQLQNEDYLISSGLTIQKPMIFQGKGNGQGLDNVGTAYMVTRIKNSSTTADAITVSPPAGDNEISGVCFRDFLIHGNDAAGTTGSGIVLDSGGASPKAVEHVELRNVTLYDNEEYGLHIKGNTFLVEAYNCNFIDNGVDGIRVDAPDGGNPSQIRLYGGISDQNAANGMTIGNGGWWVEVYGTSFSENVIGISNTGYLFLHGATFEGNTTSDLKNVNRISHIFGGLFTSTCTVNIHIAGGTEGSMQGFIVTGGTTHIQIDAGANYWTIGQFNETGTTIVDNGSGTKHLWQISGLTHKGCLTMRTDNDAGATPIRCMQDDIDQPGLYIDHNETNATGEIIKIDGVSAADDSRNISTMNGDGSVEGPKNFNTANGWAFEGMIKINVNGTDYWMPFYSKDTS